jgi:segregation and condensation protein B
VSDPDLTPTDPEDVQPDPGAAGAGASDGPPEASEGPQGALEGPEEGLDEPDGTDEADLPSDSLGAPTLEAALEALLLVTDDPLDVATLATVVRRTTGEVEAAVRALAADYDAAGRGFELREVAGGWRYYTRADCSEVVERFVRDGQQAKLTQAALETLAVVAYRQPVSRARISTVRGVNVDGVIRTLSTRGLIAEAGTDPTSQAILYRTTDLFLERLGITTLDELPPLADYLPDIELLDALADEM